jgi:hypothetical protein
VETWLAHRALANLTDIERRHPGPVSTLRAAALLHLALAAEEHLGPAPAAAVMRRATELAGADPFHRRTCERVLGGDGPPSTEAG